MCIHSCNCTNAPSDVPCGQLWPDVLLMLFFQVTELPAYQKTTVVNAVKQINSCYCITSLIAVGDFTSLNIGVNVTNKDF